MFVCYSRGTSPVTIRGEESSPVKRETGGEDINVDDISPEEVKERRRLMAAQGSLKLRLSCKCLLRKPLCLQENSRRFSALSI